jgi:putative transposase
MWGRAKLGPLVREQGFALSAATVGRIIAQLVARGAVQPVLTLRRRPYARRWTAKRHFAQRLPRDLTANEPGSLVQLDTVHVNVASQTTRSPWRKNPIPLPCTTNGP